MVEWWSSKISLSALRGDAVSITNELVETLLRYLRANQNIDRDTCMYKARDEEEKVELQKREQIRSETGWASSKRGAYRPLGTPNLHLPAPGDESLARPDERKKKSKVVDQDDIERLDLDDPIQATVRQFCYQYYEVILRERVNLRLSVKTISGDPDIFVSNDNPSPTMDDHIWRSGSKGDDEILIETDHPRYKLGSFFIAIYAICDSEYELSASLSEVPVSQAINIKGAVGNGYETLTQLVNEAEARRRLCSIGTIGATDQAHPKDEKALYRSLPAHLKTHLSPAEASAGRSADEAAPSGVNVAPKDRAKKPLAAPLSVLTTPYLAAAYFGPGLTPRTGGPKIDPASAAATAAAAAAGAGGASKVGGIERSLLASRLSSSPPAPVPTSSPPLHPWLPSGTDPSVQTDVEVITSRATTEMTTLVMQIRHRAMKEDMDKQMRRVAQGLAAERRLITHFKQKALADALQVAQDKVSAGRGLPLGEDPSDSLRSMRMQANELRQLTLHQLREVAEAEVAASQQQISGAKSARSPRMRGVSKRMSMGASMLGGNPGSESARGSDSKRKSKSRIRRESCVSNSTPIRANPVRTTPSADAPPGGALPLLSPRVRLPDGPSAAGAGSAPAVSLLPRLSTRYPVCLPQLQPMSSPSRRAVFATGDDAAALAAGGASRAMVSESLFSVSQAPAAVTHVTLTATSTEGGVAIDAIYEEMPPIHMPHAPHPPDGGKPPSGLSPRLATGLARPVPDDEQTPRARHAKKSKQPARVWAPVTRAE